MALGSFLITLFEIVGVLALIWCIFHEDRLVALEEKVLSAFRRKRLHLVKTERARSFNI